MSFLPFLSSAVYYNKVKGQSLKNSHTVKLKCCGQGREKRDSVSFTKTLFSARLLYLTGALQKGMLNTLGSHCKYIKSETKGPTFISPSVTVPLQLSVSLMQRCCCRALNMIAQIMSTFSILSSGEPAWCSRHDYFYTISPYIITPINLTMMWLGNVKKRQDPSGYQT